MKFLMFNLPFCFTVGDLMRMDVKIENNRFSSSSMFLLLPLISLLLLQAIIALGSCDLGTDKQALLDFANTLHNVPRGRLRWTSTEAAAADPICTSWVGVTCSSDRSRVVELRLPGFGLRGTISGNTTIGRLDALERLDLRNNSLFGAIPPNLNFPRLRHLNLSGNRFSGPVPQSLREFPPSSFGGNPLLCGGLDLDLIETNVVSPSTGPLGRRSLKSKKKKGLSKKTKRDLIIISVVIVILLVFLCCARDMLKRCRH
ncbi:hypothetical protein DM860_004554 [Cuscuta australis]|uniref:Leucine-rich repeat-containing N-terminal plant-type domain-containing protein n=1 Tax=Cuscuta australis TaxID=267555 RepID=A0A328EBX3_9ASTE|nr:hypothetical protein DM860_004554 [Cuscuta australis]